MADADGTLSLAASQLAPRAADVPGPGDRVGRFVIQSRLGEGGMGVVLAGLDPDLGRPVAIKLLRAGGDSPGYRARLLREAQALARLHHPNVVSVYEVGADGDRVYIAMELVTGTTLTRWLASQRRPWREVVAMFIAVGEGVAAVHRAGLVHRDLKPDNVLIDETGRARVADFGLARLATDDGEAAGSSSPALAARLTRTGAVMGTPGYMAPEQQWGSDVDARADQYSFCVAMRAALATVPLSAATTVDERGPGKQPRPAPHDWTGVPRRVRDIVTRGLAYDASERFASMDELLAALREAIASRRARVAVVIASTVFAGGVIATSIGIASGGGGGGAAVAGAPLDAAPAAVIGSGAAGGPAAPPGELVAVGSGSGGAAGADGSGGLVAVGSAGSTRPGRGTGTSIRGSGSGPGSGAPVLAGSGSGSAGSAGAVGSGSAARGTASIAALPIRSEGFGDPDQNPPIPDPALQPAVGFGGPPDAAPGPGPITSARRTALRTIANAMGYHGLDTAAVDADAAGVEQRARDTLAALIAAKGESDWDAHVARVTLAMIVRRRGDCDEASTLAATTVKLVRKSLEPAVLDLSGLSRDQIRWFARAHFLAGLCWFPEKDLGKALPNADKWIGEANALMAFAHAGDAERGEVQLAIAMVAFETNAPPSATTAWLEAAEQHGGSKVGKLAATWRKAAGL